LSKHVSLPFHFYVNVENSFLGPNMPKGMTKAIWHAVHCRENQLLMAHVLLESGAHWSGLPLHAISTKEDFSIDRSNLMPWYAMGNDIETIHLNYLEGLQCDVLKPAPAKGRHTGIIIDWSDGYSRYPAEHKPLSLIELENGQFSLLPNNFFLLTDKHFVDDEAKQNLKYYLRGDIVYWEQ
jgi:hypothetical protein